MFRRSQENITLMMTADDPRSAIRRNLGTTKGALSCSPGVQFTPVG